MEENLRNHLKTFLTNKLIDNSSQNTNMGITSSPKFHNNNHKLFTNEHLIDSSKQKSGSFKKNVFRTSGTPTDNDLHRQQNDQNPVQQNIMKVGNLFMFNVFENNNGSVTPSSGL